MGSPPIRGARPPSHVAYYVALAGVVGLLLLLLCYFMFFCIKRVKELTIQEYCTSAPASAPRLPPSPAAYPIQPVVRDSASAMAKLCRQLPSQPVGGTVFPTSDPPATAPAEAPTSPVKTGPVVPVITVAPANEAPPVR